MQVAAIKARTQAQRFIVRALHSARHPNACACACGCMHLLHARASMHLPIPIHGGGLVSYYVVRLVCRDLKMT